MSTIDLLLGGDGKPYGSKCKEQKCIKFMLLEVFFPVFIYKNLARTLKGEVPKYADRSKVEP